MAYTQKDRWMAVGTPLGDDVLLLDAIEGEEWLGELFEYTLSLTSDKVNLKSEDIIGQGITVRMEIAEEGTRYIHGIVSVFAFDGFKEGLAKYRATIVPSIWLLTRRADCRVFQEMSIVDIIKKVFQDAGLSDYEMNLSESYTTRAFCVQYRESDFNFISRLMEEEGVYYYFKHEDGKHTLVIADSPGAHEDLTHAATLPYRTPGDEGEVGEDHVSAWTMEDAVQSGAYAHTDYNFIKPTLELKAMSKLASGAIASDAEVFDYPGRYAETADGERLARVRVEEIHAQYRTYEGETNARGMACGGTFTLEDHSRDDFNRKYLVVGTSISAKNSSFGTGQGDDEDLFTCEIEAIESDTVYRPQRVAEKPIIPGAQTAFVVGKDGEEIDCDEHGRVRVRFHWDRGGESTEDSSCLIRVAQVWAGQNWGAMFLPRVGQEVIVEFLEGDPDRPIITGRVYNGASKPPYALPGEKTKSTIKSNSSKGGEGFNEIRFEDKKDSEQILVHAQKDADIRVKNDAKEWIGNDRHMLVIRHQVEQVVGSRHEVVDTNHHEKIVGARHLKIEGSEVKHIDTKHSLKVGDDSGEEYGKNKSIKVTEQCSVKAKIVVIEAEENITLKVGQAYIAIEKDSIKIAVDNPSGKIEVDTKGEISIKSLKDTTIEATQNFSAKGTAGAKIEGTAQVEVKGAQATLAGDAMCTVKGGLVKIN